MKRTLFPLFLSSALLVCCKKPPTEVTSTETRGLTTKDGEVKLHASSDERFRDTKPSPIQGEAPEGWLVRPPTQFRLVNYAFGQSGDGEVYVSLSQGTVLDNVNRWLKQFSLPDLDAAGVAALPKIAMLGNEGVWVEAAGTYAGGMGKAPATDRALAGVVVSIGADIYTVKMVGSTAEVAAEKEKLQAYVKSLRMGE